MMVIRVCEVLRGSRRGEASISLVVRARAAQVAAAETGTAAAAVMAIEAS